MNDDEDDEDDREKRLVIVVSVGMRKLLALFHKPIEWSGHLVEFFLNLRFVRVVVVGEGTMKGKLSRLPEFFCRLTMVD